MSSWRVLLWIVVVMFDPSSSETLTVVLGSDICLPCTNCTDCKYDLESHPELKIEDGCLLIKNANMTHSKSWKCPPNVSYWLEVEIPFQLLDIKSFNDGRIECLFDPGYPELISSEATLQCQDPGDQRTTLALNRSSVEYYGFQEKHSFSVNRDELDPECRNYTVTCSGSQFYNHTKQTEQKTKVWPNPIWGDHKKTPRTPIEPRVSLSLDNEDWLPGGQVNGTCFAVGDSSGMNLTVAVQNFGKHKVLSESLSFKAGESYEQTLKFWYQVDQRDQGGNLTCRGSFGFNPTSTILEIDVIPLQINASPSSTDSTSNAPTLSTTPKENVPELSGWFILSMILVCLLGVVVVLFISKVVFHYWKKKHKHYKIYSLPIVTDPISYEYSKLDFIPRPQNKMKIGYAQVTGVDVGIKSKATQSANQTVATTKEKRRNKTRNPSDVLPAPPVEHLIRCDSISEDIQAAEDIRVFKIY